MTGSRDFQIGRALLEEEKGAKMHAEGSARTAGVRTRVAADEQWNKEVRLD